MRKGAMFGWALFVLGFVLLGLQAVVGLDVSETSSWRQAALALAGAACLVLATVVLVGSGMATMISALSGSSPSRLRDGVATTATVVSATHTGVTINDVILVFDVVLMVRPPAGGAPVQATTRTRVATFNTHLLAPGAELPVRVDAADLSKVVIDLEVLATSAASTATVSGAAPGQGGPRPSPISSDDILATGAAGIASVVSSVATGRTAAELTGSTPTSHPERGAWPAVVLGLQVRPSDGGPDLVVQSVYAVPPELRTRVGVGATLPVAYVEHTEGVLVAINWARVAAS